jgi:prepilin-type processing-associated H-X9-DG protein
MTSREEGPPVATTPDAAVSRSAIAALALSILLWVAMLVGLAILVGALNTPTWLLIPRFTHWAAWLAPSVVVLAVAFVIVGRGALLQISRSSGRLSGATVARTAIIVAVTGGVFGLTVLLFSNLLLRGIGFYRGGVCLANVKNIALAVQMYLTDYNDVFPPAGTWCDTMEPYVRNPAVYVCPEMRGLPCGYGFNAGLDSLPIRRLVDPEYTIVIFETDVGWNATGQLERLRDPPRHLGGDNFAFADGHGQRVGRRQLLDDKGATYRFYPNLIPPPATADAEGN